MPTRKHLLLAVVLFCYAVTPLQMCAGEEGCTGNRRVLCYECSTKRGDRYCRDPFNTSSEKAKAYLCDGMCVKWVQIPRSGVKHVTRTCNTKLTMSLHPALVCMKESRPGDGHMCFCNSHKCNSASTPHLSAAYLLLLPLVLLKLRD